MNAIHRAIELLGGPSQTAGILGVTPQAVCFWRDGKRKFPDKCCPAIEMATNGEISCEQLRPDIEWLRISGKVFRRVDDCCEFNPSEQATA